MRNSACTKVSRSFGNFSDFCPFPEWFLEEIRGRQIVTLALQVWRAWRDRRVFCWKILLDFELEAVISSAKSRVPSRINPAAKANAASISGFARYCVIPQYFRVANPSWPIPQVEIVREGLGAACLKDECSCRATRLK
jgi:hypothetical protein